MYIILSTLLFISVINYSLLLSQSFADSGYYYLNHGNKKKAAGYFELHLKENPKDLKTRLQLGYLYYDQRQLDKSLRHFDYVEKHTSSATDRDLSKSASLVIREELANTSARSFDVYFYNFYDSFQENYIANLVAHYNFRIGPGFYVGPYLDVYTDTRSTKQVVFNDRFVEAGFFLRYNILRNLFIEGRIGYARQIDLDSNKINLKPMIVYFNGFGEAKVYVSSGASSRTSFYMDIYYAAMYGYKYKNTFLQGSLQQVLRFHTVDIHT